MKRTTYAAGCFIAGTLLAATSAQAAVLVSENYDSKTEGNLIGQSAALGSTGLSGNYGFNGDANDSGQSFNVVAGGLAFSTYSTTSGNSLRGSTAGVGFVAVASLSLGAGFSYTGTLYSSYLINLSTLSTGTGLASTRITPASNSIGTASRFNLGADTGVSNAINPGIAYDNSTTASGTNLVINTTYMVIGRFTNVGTALNDTTTQGVATMFALTAAQWDSFIAGGGTDTYLDGAAVGTGVGQISAKATDTVTTGTFDFATGSFFQTVISASTTSGGTQTATFDNMLYGTTLKDVTVPEPSVALLGALGTLALLRRRR